MNSLLHWYYRLRIQQLNDSRLRDTLLPRPGPHILLLDTRLPAKS